MDNIIAYCGIDCSKCEAYSATQANDRIALESIAEKWRKQFHAEGITAESVMCDGCTRDGKKSGYCNDMCAIRKCAAGKAVPNCAHCSEYESCNELQTFFAYPGTAEAKAMLDGIRLNNH